ncbi:MAG: urate hydroxylase PuuD [Rhizobiaceae bacterium]
MYEFAIAWDWISFAVRWLHVITAIAWIGSSFYFIALDLGLRQRPGLPEGAHGEEWQVHGGGFYHIQKYLVAPAEMPEHLTWFKWESYATWLSGFAMLAIVYYVGADLYLVDPNVLDVSPLTAILISLASIGIGWVFYDFLCKSRFGEDNTRLMIFLFVILVAMAWGYTQVFTGRAAFLHLGAITATIMSANVFLIIIPNQKIVVADLIAGRKPDPKYGKIAKQRSTHNNYLTLPVLFLMLSNHYPLAFATQYNWVIASLVFLMGVTIRHYFNSQHARTGNPTWTWLVTALLFVIIMWLSTVPKVLSGEEDARAMTPHEQRFASAAGFEEVRDLVQGRCSMCHASEPAWEGMIVPPKGVRFETDAEIAQRAREIYLHAGASHAMPPPNAASFGVMLEPEERQMIVSWYRGAVGAN